MKEPMAGGVFLAVGALAGVGVGAYYDQTSAGLLTGLAIGAGIALYVWLRSRNL